MSHAPHSSYRRLYQSAPIVEDFTFNRLLTLMVAKGSNFNPFGFQHRYIAKLAYESMKDLIEREVEKETDRWQQAIHEMGKSAANNNDLRVYELMRGLGIAMSKSDV